MEWGIFDIMMLVIASVLGGHFLSMGAREWLARQDATTETTEPTKPITPELIHKRIVKGQWRLIEKRMSNLTTVREPPSTGLSSISSIKMKRHCVGVIYLGTEERVGYNDKPLLQPIPLCKENRDKLIVLGFTEFTSDGLWVFYVEPQ